ncbi:MAG: hypothetical protein Q9P14_13505 [candidate division KSB1 bacterium]|nr:hypothetical protein [candidate division KSB1 bacterium]MDQ7064603.1 hypothetical protein [candidate division KSB1 bacterium]
MITDSEIKKKGMEILIKELGEVGAERFIALILRDSFDYTEWQKDLWKNDSVEELSRKANEYLLKQKKVPE